MTEDTNPPATEDETPGATAKQPAMDSTPATAEATQTSVSDAAAEAEGVTEARAETGVATATALEEPPAAESGAPTASEPLTTAAEAVTEATASPEAPSAEAPSAEAPAALAVEEPPTGNGTAEPMTMAELLEQPDVDGALVGGASLDVGSFTAICETAARLSRS